MSATRVPNFIGGRLEESRSEQFEEIPNPATGETIAVMPYSTSEEINRAVAAANEAFPAWSETPVPERAQVMFRFKQLLDELRARVENSTPELIPSSILDRTVNHLQNAETELDAFFENADQGHLQNADVHIDNVAVELRVFPPLPPSKESAAVVKAAKGYAEQIGSLERAARENLRSLASDIEGLATEVVNAKQELESLAKDEEGQRQQAKSDLEVKVSESRGEIDAKVSEARGEIDAQKVRLDQAITQQQESFLANQQSRLEEFNNSQKSREATFGEKAEAALTDAKSRFDGLETRAQALVESLEGQENRARQIVGLTAATEVAGAYIKDAEVQKRNADQWRLAALVIFLVVIAATPFAVLRDPPDTDASASETITYVLSRIPLLLGGGVGGYLIKESGSHRRRERDSRRMANELTTFRPFLAELQEGEMQTEIREASKRYFQGAEPPGEPQK